MVYIYIGLFGEYQWETFRSPAGLKNELKQFLTCVAILAGQGLPGLAGLDKWPDLTFDS